jgi:hypothetical protein
MKTETETETETHPIQLTTFMVVPSSWAAVKRLAVVRRTSAGALVREALDTLLKRARESGEKF